MGDHDRQQASQLETAVRMHCTVNEIICGASPSHSCLTSYFVPVRHDVALASEAHGGKGKGDHVTLEDPSGWKNSLSAHNVKATAPFGNVVQKGVACYGRPPQGGSRVRSESTEQKAADACRNSAVRSHRDNGEVSS